MPEAREEWRVQLSAAYDCSIRDNRPATVSFATVALDGQPAARTMVFRGFREQTDQLVLVTDSRSSKIEQLSAHPWAELSWYCQTTRQQFRLAGNVRIVSHTEEDPSLAAVRTSIWKALSDRTRAMFFQPPPGRNKRDTEEGGPNAEDGAPPTTFSLILLDPVRVDCLNVGTEPHERSIYRVGPAGDWFKREVYP